MRDGYEIQGPTPICAGSGRELKPGDRIYTALLEEAGKFVRKDFAAEVWSGPPHGAIAFWKGRVSASPTPRKPKFNDELLLDCFHHLNGTTDPNRRNFRYVVALLLMRRKRLKFEDLKQDAEGGHVLMVREAKSGARHEVADPRLSEAEIEAVQDEVFNILGWE